MPPRYQHLRSVPGRLAAAVVLLAVSSNVGACADESPAEPSDVVAPATITEVFAGTLEQAATRHHTFASQSGTANVTLASLVNAAGEPQNVSVTVGLGQLSDTGCVATTSASARPALTAQLSSSVNGDAYCVSIADAGTLAGPVTYTLRVEHP